ncbi:hypothetical protein [Couchioplanes azureus]|uniref:hypothetical protein n=1 Tax=Couchioplanes caeruleus TaxID=56438 RepID=UPI00166FAAEB|nr:hypothetical protein [Couchioplanes caeruleus]GGQ55620.1 hypothetical protein GCM10010166_26140 [Couchioplanes caeruleus subsp. azureus]
MAADEPLPDDDGPIPMTAQERTVWATLVTVIVSSGAYFALVVPRLLTRPVPEISWVAPMLWTIGLSVAAALVLTIACEVIAAAGRRGSCVPAGRGEVTSDVRDREIGRIGWGASMTVISVGFGAALVLAMLDADTFWIGNLLFLFGAVSAVVETVTRIRLYRRGF